MERTRVVDSHVHFWDPAALHYPWLDDLGALQRVFLPIDYTPLITRDVDAVVFIEANCVAAEAESELLFIETLAKIEPRVVGTVAFVDLLDEAALEQSLHRLAQHERVIGVRHNIQSHAPGFCIDENFVRGVQRVGQCGLTFDLCATADQLHDVALLVKQCPGTRFVLDHCGKPAIRDDAFESWALDIVDVAGNGNVSCKLSGLFTEARPDQRHGDALAIYADHVLACFGVPRLLYGSDWPVVTLGGGLSAWRRFTDQFTSTWQPADRQRFYADNAIALYGLELHAHS